MFRLPTLQDLTDEQKAVIDLPLDGSYLVTGPPGSGKTVVAVHRALSLARLGEPVLVLTYGNILRRYVQGAVDGTGLHPDSVSTLHTWFPKWFWANYGQRPPQVDRWTFDWPGCMTVLGSKPLPEARPHIIVDEGQDMPPDFYMLFRALGRTLTVFADQNQTIHDDNSTNEEIRVRGGLKHAFDLTTNFRNTPAIAEFAGSFWQGAGAPPGRTAEGVERGDPPVLDADDSISDLVDRIVRFEKRNPHQDIGILVEHGKTLMRLFFDLDEAGLVNPPQTYISWSGAMKKMRPLDFSKRGVKLLTWQSAKGLQFDSVFLPELNRTKPDGVGNDRFRMQMYVLASRATSELYLTYSGVGEPALIRELPMDLVDDWR